MNFSSSFSNDGLNEREIFARTHGEKEKKNNDHRFKLSVVNIRLHKRIVRLALRKKKNPSFFFIPMNDDTEDSSKSKIIPTECKICGAPALYKYFGATACHACKIFFKRNAHKSLVC